MSNELIVIEQANAVAVLSTDDGIKTLLDNVRANIDNMDGGSMKNKTSRQKIRSNAFAATKAFKKINDETIEPLIADLTAKIQPQLDVINAVKANQSVLQSGLQQIRKDVNADVDKFEAELQRIEDEKIEAERVAAVDRDYDFAKVLYNEYLQQVIMGESILADWEKARLDKEEADRIAREKKIAEDAAAAAKLKAEQDVAAEKQRLIDEKAAAELEAENQRKAAMQADIDLENEREQAREKELKLNEERRVDYHKRMIQHIIDCGNGVIGGQPQSYGILFFELENKIVIDDSFEEFKDQAITAKNNAIENLKSMQEKQIKEAKEADQRRIYEKKEAEKVAEKKRLDAIEQTKIAEAKKISDQKILDDQETATRRANVAHATGIKKSIIASLMEHAGLSKEAATATASALWYGKISNINVTI